MLRLIDPDIYVIVAGKTDFFLVKLREERGVSMGLFKKKVNTEKWASLVIKGYQKGMPVDEKVLKEATHSYVMQRSRIANESLDLAVNSPDQKTRAMRQDLVREQAKELQKLRPYATAEDQIIIDTITFNAKWMEETVNGENTADIQTKRNLKKAKKEAFWDVQGQMDMIDVFSEDWKK